MNPMDELKNNSLETPLDSKVQAVVDELTSMSSMLRIDVQESVLRNTGVLTTDKEMGDDTFQNALRQEVLTQIEKFGTIKATMFICPRVDVRDMSNPSLLYPTNLSISSVDGRRADIFVSRIPRIFQLFQQLAQQDANFELVLVIGDSDFAPNVGYQWKAIEYASQKGGYIGNFDEEIFAARTRSYQRYLIELFKANAVQNEIQLFDVVASEESKSSRTIRILSFYELYRSDSVPISNDKEFNQEALEEETGSKLGHYREAVKKYDTNFFGRLSIEEVRNITKGKFQTYRDQGLYVTQNHGSILLSDELPPVLKAEMYRNQLIILWPWIRKEDPERNPETVSDKTYKVKLVEPAIEC